MAINQSVNQSIIQSVFVYLKNTANLLGKRLKKKIEEQDWRTRLKNKIEEQDRRTRSKNKKEEQDWRRRLTNKIEHVTLTKLHKHNGSGRVFVFGVPSYFSGAIAPHVSIAAFVLVKIIRFEQTMRHHTVQQPWWHVHFRTSAEVVRVTGVAHHYDGIGGFPATRTGAGQVVVQMGVPVNKRWSTKEGPQRWSTEDGPQKMVHKDGQQKMVHKDGPQRWSTKKKGPQT